MTGDPAGPALSVEQVTVTFGALAALSEVSVWVRPGSVHAVIGPNGAGKSTLFNVVSGVYRPTSGRVMLGPTELTGLRPHRIAALGVGRAFQNMAASGHESVLDNVMVGRHHLMRSGFVSSGLKLPGARREERRHLDRAAEIAAFLGLGDLLDVPVGILPYGDRKRVEVARALATEPRVILLDEPVAGMNGAESVRMSEAIRTLNQALGITVVLVEHDMTTVMAVADRISVLDFGRLIAEGTPHEIQHDPAVIGAYLGTGTDTAAADIGAALRHTATAPPEPAHTATAPPEPAHPGPAGQSSGETA